MSKKGFIPYKEFRCDRCRRLLFYGDLKVAKIEIKCPRCDKIVVIGVDMTKKMRVLTGRGLKEVSVVNF